MGFVVHRLLRELERRWVTHSSRRAMRMEGVGECLRGWIGVHSKFANTTAATTAPDDTVSVRDAPDVDATSIAAVEFAYERESARRIALRSGKNLTHPLAALWS